MRATILISDDNVALARGFAQALAGAGYSACVGHSAEDGLHLARSRQSDAIILDIRMPFINGVGFLYRLRQQRTLRDVPVIVVTGGEVTEDTRAELRDLRARVTIRRLTLRHRPVGWCYSNRPSRLVALLGCDTLASSTLSVCTCNRPRQRASAGSDY
jgi:CheY-like chemotaxis protein